MSHSCTKKDCHQNQDLKSWLLLKLIYTTIMRFGLVSLFKGISTFMGYLMLKQSCRIDNIQRIAGSIRGFYTFPRGISLKVNVIEQLEFELTHFEAAVLHFSHYTIETPSIIICKYHSYKICSLRKQITYLIHFKVLTLFILVSLSLLGSPSVLKSHSL